MPKVLVPVHEHLIELGILEHQARMKKRGQKYLFPELAPKSAKKKFHSALRYNWQKLREIQLDGNPRDLDAHSLRHSFNQALKLETSVNREVRLDSYPTQRCGEASLKQTSASSIRSKSLPSGHGSGSVKSGSQRSQH